MTSAEVAVLFRVDTVTVARWAREGRIVSCVTPGGRYRFPAREVRFLLGQSPALVQS
ncbi:helix-turn-helix domain-containing protein [Nocardiopsis sp. FR6]|uniref:helix-turn-helix domain-containing protein n=1 Tax=Nocardiopsis sp. FR6 TaxID=2605986 RepID=UPI00351A09D2